MVGLLGGLFQLNLLVATSGTTDWPGTYIALAAICLVVAVSQAGRTYGLDARLARRRPDPRLPVYLVGARPAARLAGASRARPPRLAAAGCRR